jgi:hypothetical protein
LPRFGDTDDPGDDREARLARRLAVVRGADVDGPTARLHAAMLRFIARNVE